MFFGKKDNMELPVKNSEWLNFVIIFHKSFSHPNGLNNLEDSRSTNDKYKKSQKPRSNRIFFFLGFLQIKENAKSYYNNQKT